MLRKVWLLLGWGGVIAVFYFCLIPEPPTPPSIFGFDKVPHFSAYALLMLWFSQVYLDWKPRFGVFAALAAMGIAIEYLQRMTGYRSFEYADMVADALGALIGWGLACTPLGKIMVALENSSAHRRNDE